MTSYVSPGPRVFSCLKLQGITLTPPKVSWVYRVASESDFQYMARVQQIAFAKQAPLKFRVGGGACLGLVGIDSGDEKPRLWQVTNVPSKWAAQDVVRCLEGAGCEDGLLKAYLGWLSPKLKFKENSKTFRSLGLRATVFT